MEKVLLKSINFNIRNDKDKNNYTLIYLVLYVGEKGKNKQYKLPFAKVIAKYWNSKQQLPILTAKGMSSEMKQQQLTINQLITDIKCTLCVGNSYTIDEIRKLIENKTINIISQNEYGTLKNKGYITGVDDNESNYKEKLPKCQVLIKNKNKMPITAQFISAKRTPKATKAIKRVFKNWKENSPKSEGTLNQYYYDLMAWVKWVEKTNQRDGYSLFNVDGVIAYREYLTKKGVKPDTINYKLRLLCQVINELAATNERKKGINYIEPKLVLLKNFVKNKKQKEEITSEDITSFKVVECFNESEEFYKNLFLLQIATGQRVSDLYTILQGEYQVISNGVKIFIKVVNKKGSRPKMNNYKFSYIELTTEVKGLIEILQKSKVKESCYNFLRKEYNVILKKLFERANITRNSVNGKPLFKEISSHYGRHTFATQQVRNTTDKGSIAKMMGCTEQMITNVYMHQSDMDIINSISQAQGGTIN
ncbi:tyrosine-type recombinase/integrase [Prevotella veroralis]|uniref:Site-specific recombinase, phage integrase family n=1 Tax=Prevotella veroralis F0319 TaxID=649761 RepID=C9MPR0_9BACT|nr:tyrosine-type recombinase/integrase [Prevotella veroralis]EEX18413.1 site-specific recombinase, phage integrase family [Prevotella veroralis F0319]QUB39985.1 tyrosine-type recombinase/integrase [Prevotella veroralis]